MDHQRFDDLPRCVGARVSRRATLGAALTGLVGAAAGHVAGQEATPATTAIADSEKIVTFAP